MIILDISGQNMAKPYPKLFQNNQRHALHGPSLHCPSFWPTMPWSNWAGHTACFHGPQLFTGSGSKPDVCPDPKGQGMARWSNGLNGMNGMNGMVTPLDIRIHFFHNLNAPSMGYLNIFEIGLSWVYESICIEAYSRRRPSPFDVKLHCALGEYWVNWRHRSCPENHLSSVYPLTKPFMWLEQ